MSVVLGVPIHPSLLCISLSPVLCLFIVMSVPLANGDEFGNSVVVVDNSDFDRILDMLQFAQAWP